ncbi:alpha-1B adrenergic receptor-like [Actinia tenebrosa]|uniref:Alpha-1B adrenergic receptor-like n=1 Tax=Actinia tenebrosa TaxID=6105 RepID=A0A6P8IK62_ACTTE|nr:alpha-1B adrenergic receptor-like [Actinia tenebrosa]
MKVLKIYSGPSGHTIMGRLNISEDLFQITKPTVETVLIWLVPFVVLGVLIVMSNILTIITLVVNRHLRRRSVYCLINLAVADALYDAVLTSYSWCVLGETFFDFEIDFKTQGMFIPSLIAIMVSLFSLVLVSLERLYATFFPFRHRTATPSTYTLAFIITWLLALLTSLFYHLTPKTKSNITVGIYWFLLALSIAIIIISYAAIFLRIRLRNQLHQDHNHQSSRTIKLMRERQLAITLFIVTLLSTLTWVPYIGMRIFYPVTYTFYDRLKVLPRGFSVIYAFQCSNSLINPIVYLFRMRDFRNALFRLLFRCSKGPPRHINPLSSYTFVVPRQGIPPLELELSNCAFVVPRQAAGPSPGP